MEKSIIWDFSLRVPSSWHRDWHQHFSSSCRTCQEHKPNTLRRRTWEHYWDLVPAKNRTLPNCVCVSQTQQSEYLSVCASMLSVSSYVSMYVSMYKCICVCMHQPIYLSIHPSIHVIYAKKNTLLSSNLRASLTNNESRLQLFVILDPSCPSLQLLAAGDLNTCDNMPPLRLCKPKGVRNN